MAHIFVLMERSAMPNRQKRVSLVQEVVRILRNTKQDLSVELRNSLVSEFSLRMKMSGYSEQFRYEVISSAMACYEKQLTRASEGTCPSYRPKGYKEEERRREKELVQTLFNYLILPPHPQWPVSKTAQEDI